MIHLTRLARMIEKILMSSPPLFWKSTGFDGANKKIKLAIKGGFRGVRLLKLQADHDHIIGLRVVRFPVHYSFIDKFFLLSYW